MARIPVSPLRHALIGRSQPLRVEVGVSGGPGRSYSVLGIAAATVRKASRRGIRGFGRRVWVAAWRGRSAAVPVGAAKR
jgi:hypothetical protein